jgi:hypothetical protein
VKLTPEDLDKLQTKQLANVIRKLNSGKTLTAREEALLAQSRVVAGTGSEIHAPGLPPATPFVSTWDDLAKQLGVTRRAIQEWRKDERYSEHCPPDRADGRHDVTAWASFMVRFGLKRADEQLTDDETPAERRSVRDWKEYREQLQCEKLQRHIAREDGVLLVAAELEIPLGATFMAIQTKLSQFPERAARRVAGFDDVSEVEARLREEMDGDLGELNAAQHLDADLMEIVSGIPLDESKEKTVSLLTIRGIPREETFALIKDIAAEVLRRIGRRVLARASAIGVESPALAEATEPEKPDCGDEISQQGHDEQPGGIPVAETAAAPVVKRVRRKPAKKGRRRAATKSL